MPKPGGFMRRERDSNHLLLLLKNELIHYNNIKAQLKLNLITILFQLPVT